MPRRQPTISYQTLRDHCEKWEWKDPRTNVTVRGYNPPEGAKGKRQVPFFIKYLTLRGVVEQGTVVCLKVFLYGGASGKGAHQRMIQFVESKQVRRICDILIMEVDGIKVI